MKTSNTVTKKATVRTSPSEVAQNVANSKRKTVETRLENANANKKGKKTPVSTEKDGITYLKEGVTGKAFNKAKIDTTKAVKQERATISRCMSDAYNEDKGFFSSINLSKTAMKKAFAPAEILKQASNYHLVCYYNSLNDDKKGFISFNVYWTLGYIKASLDGRDVNPIAVKFFEALKADDTQALRAVAKTAQKEVAKAAKKKETKEEESK